jgi:DegV family protein with EDD domain
MPKLAVVTDSSAYLPAELLQRYGIQVIPLNVHFNGSLYKDGVDITEEEFFRKLAAAPELPSTSQPSAGEFAEFFRRAAQGADGVVAIVLSSSLSGTYSSAITAKDMLPDLPIAVVDSRTTSMGMGFLVLAAARAAQEGKSLEEVVAVVEGLVNRVSVVFMPDTLKYLAKGGRIGNAAALMGSVLAIKPLLEVAGGKVEPLEKVRTRSKAIARLVGVLKERCDGRPAHVAVIHTLAPQEAEQIRQQIARDFPHVNELFTTGVSPVIGTHVGPGCLGLCFYAE